MANPAIDTDFMIGTTEGGKVTLRSLGITNPHPIWRSGVTSIKLGDGSARVLGLAIVEWNFGFLQQAQRDVLRTYCTGASAHLFITTTTTEKIGGVENAAVAYEGECIWPAPDRPEDPQTGRRLEFVLTFRQLIPT